MYYLRPARRTNTAIFIFSLCHYLEPHLISYLTMRFSEQGVGFFISERTSDYFLYDLDILEFIFGSQTCLMPSLFSEPIFYEHGISTVSICLHIVYTKL